MAEHRRVESRGIVGTGMTTDPDRIREVEEDAERKKRSWRNAPEKGFGDVLEKAPPKGELADEESEDPRKKKKPEPPSAAPSEAALADAALGGSAPASSTPAPVALADATSGAPEKSAKAALPRVPKDPREAMLRKLLEANKNKPPNAFDVNTPPTGSRSRKPT
jgi:hypothetical protein